MEGYEFDALLEGSQTKSNIAPAWGQKTAVGSVRRNAPVKYIPLIWSGLWRERTRTIFTLLSIAVAFIVFGILSGIDAGFAHSLEVSRLDRLFTDSRFGADMPLSYAEQIARLPGVALVVHRRILSGYFQDPRNPMGVICTDERFFSIRPEVTITREQVRTLRQTRTGAVVGVFWANKYGWKVGDKIPLQSDTPHADGNRVWTFDIVGIVDDENYPGQAGWFIANYEYLDQGRATEKGTIDRFLVRINDPNRATQIGRQIDKLFASSAAPTRTSSEKTQAQSGLQFIGDVNFFTDAVVGAVFFMLLFVTGNTMVQSIRERTPEFAVLKTLGFSDKAVLCLVIAESVLLCVLAAVAGLLVSKIIIPIARHMLGFGLLLQMTWLAMLRGFGLALVVALVSSIYPALRVKRLSIVDALAGR
jgi:putative ABC transport system permease protein